MIRLLSPLVIGTVLFVMVLGITRLILMPEALVSSLLALLFFPLVIGALLVRSKNNPASTSATRIPGKLRAALVGAGVALGCAMLLSITDQLGLTDPNAYGNWRSLAALLPAGIAVFADILSARLEHKALEKTD